MFELNLLLCCWQEPSSSTGGWYRTDWQRRLRFQIVLLLWVIVVGGATKNRIVRSCRWVEIYDVELTRCFWQLTLLRLRACCFAKKPIIMVTSSVGGGAWYRCLKWSGAKVKLSLVLGEREACAWKVFYLHLQQRTVCSVHDGRSWEQQLVTSSLRLVVSKAIYYAFRVALLKTKN